MWQILYVFMLKLYLCSREQKINKQINNLFLGTRKRYTGRDEIYQVVTFDFPPHDCKDSRYGKKKSDEKQKLQKKKVWRKTKITEKASFAKSEVEMSDAGEKIRGMSWSTKITFLVQNSVLGGISFISG